MAGTRVVNSTWIRNNINIHVCTVIQLHLWNLTYLTGPMNGLVTASDLASEINKLPVFPAVEVSIDETDTSRTFTVTFKADRGTLTITTASLRAS